MNKPSTIDEYIERFPKETQSILQQVRTIIKKSIPDAGETISYAIPCFTLNGSYLIYFAGYKNHIGMYPIPKAGKEFEKELLPFKKGKSTLQFPLNKPLPVRLISKVVKLSVKSNLEKAKKKKIKK